MFENIDNIKWDDLKAAEGSASRVPNALRGLISNNPEIQKSSYWKLENHVVRQSDLYESAYYVVPFLIEIIKSSLHTGRNYVYDLLYEIANGYAPDDSLCFHDGKEIPLMAACRIVVSDGSSLYLSELSNKSSTVREKALELLISLREHKNVILPHLQDLLVKEEEVGFRRLLGDAISELSKRSPDENPGTR